MVTGRAAERAGIDTPWRRGKRERVSGGGGREEREGKARKEAAPIVHPFAAGVFRWDVLCGSCCVVA